MIRRVCRSIQNVELTSKTVKGCAKAVLGLAFALSAAFTASAQVNVTTYHNDNMRSGQNTNETILTPSNVNVSTFGKLFSYNVDGYVYAQPLYMANVTMGSGTVQAGTTHNVIYIATQNDTVYAFDADSNGGSNASPLWQKSLLGSGEKPVPNSDVSTGDIVPQIGITSTPVIDPNSNTIYVVAKSTVSDTTFYFRLHALDITTGQEKFGGPVLLQASVPGNGNGSSGGTLAFDPLWENNRPGLLLQNGIVYIGFAAHGDNGPWHGWILGYNAQTLKQTGAYCASPNAAGSGVWMSGAGLAADMPNPTTQPYGRMFVATGNGTFDAVTPYKNNMDFGDSVLHLDLTNGAITVVDDFTPYNQSSLNSSDMDLASGGTLLLPDQTSGGHTHLLVQVGKQGVVYLVDRDTMNGYNSSTDNVVEEVSGVTGGLWSMPAYWNNNVYVWGSGSRLKSFALSGGKLPTTPTIAGTISSNFPGATPAVSSSGTSNGIVWTIQTDGYSSNSPAILRAFNATNVATELYDSTQANTTNNNRTDTAGAAVKFAVPTVTNGKVYVGTQTQVNVYGLLGGTTQVATPVISPAGKSFTGSVTVTITDSTSGATIHYTTDGSTPGASSPTYPSGGITVSTTETISAIATATGQLNSTVAAQTYTLQTQTVAPIFSPAPNTFSSATNVTITDATSGSTIYYTTDGSTPVPGQGTTKQYSAAVPISATTVLSAIATASGLTNSPVTTGTYTISTSGGTPTIDFSLGFSNSASLMTFNGATDLDDTRLQLSNGGTDEADSAWYNTPVNIQSFTTNFAFQLSNPAGDGMTFTIQNAGLNAVGPYGGGLGYGPDTPGGGSNNGNAPITNSVAIKFDFYSNDGEGTDSTGLYQNGASPTIPAIDMTSSGLNLLSGDTMNVQMVYNGTTLTMTITDAVAGTSFTTSWNVNIPSIVGGNTAYVGFTAGTGTLSSSQKVETWTFTSGGTGTTQTAATPTFSLAAGTYLGTQSVTLSDTTSGATIYYTTNNTTPSTSSTKYTGAITVASTETIQAIAVASGYSNSATASAAYTIESQVAAPTFSPAGGSYAAAQSVTIAATSGATIYYTTNNTTPTTSSTQYTGPISVASSETIQAIAVQSGFFNSNVASATYTIGSGSTAVISLGSGFSSGSMIMNGGAALSGTRLRVTNGGTYQASSAWYNAPVNIQQFTTNFSFQITGGTSPTGDGFAFVIQNGPSTSVGPYGGGLGYAGITNSVAVKFDLYSNAGEGIDSTGEYVNGATPTVPAVDMTSSGVNLHTTDVFNVQMTYNGTTLTLTLTITDATTAKTFTQAWTVNIPSTVGGNSAYVGFTGGTGQDTAIQDIINWTMTSTPTATATPTFSPGGGTYTSAQTVTISSATAGATIYYTTNNTTPTTSSTQYTGPITVAASETLEAIAVASGFTTSGLSVASYTISTQTQPAATPTFSPAGGSYSSAQTVTISSTTAGATIYYTTNGTTPSTLSSKYTGAITVSTSETLEAIAVASGFSNSAVGSAVYTIGGSGSTLAINDGSGFTSTGMTLNGNTALSGTRLRLTNAPSSAYEAGSAWNTAPVNIQTFTTDFTFQVATTGTAPLGNGLTFTIQNAGTTALGPNGGGLGYGPSSPGSGGIGTSVAVKFDLVNNAGEGTNSTGLYTNGASPTVPATTIGGGVALNSGDIFAVHMTYDGTTLTMTITDTTNTTKTFTTSWPVNIPSIVGSNTALVGFTAATGYSQANQDIITWTFSNSGTTAQAATPTFSPAGGTYTSAQTVTISSTTAGATIYYTTNNTTPTTSSKQYTGPITVAASETVQAIAVASGVSNSAVGSATYTINGAPTIVINDGSGFTSTGMTLNGNTAMSGTRLRLTNAPSSAYEAGSAWNTAPVNIQTFTTDFTFQVATTGTAPLGNGLTFTIQNAGTTALGPNGGGLGYGPSSPGSGGIGTSVAVKFDLVNNAGEGTNSTGLYTNGASPTVPATTIGGGVALNSGDIFAVHMTYDGTTLTMTITDTTNTAKTFTTSWPVNVPSVVGSNTALVGFTAATGYSQANQDIITWTYSH